MQTWYTINLNPIATGEHYNVIGDFNCALFISKIAATSQPNGLHKQK